MKRLFGLKKKKIKIGGDEDDNAQDTSNNRSYSPPSVGNNTSGSSAYDFKQVNGFPNLGVDFDNATAGLAHQISSSSDNKNNNNNNNNNKSDDTIGAGYRYALTAYNDTINPAVSNEDGMGGGGGTLRSRLRGSGGKNNRSLIPSFQPLDSNNYNGDAKGVEKSRTPLHNNLHSSRNINRRDEGWSPIPEEPRSSTTSSDGREEEKGGDDTKKSSERVVKFNAPIEEYDVIPPSSTRSTHTSQQTSPTNPSQQQQQQQQQKQQQAAPILQPDAIYEEKYGDAYIDKLPKYLYPSGYQSMRPRSGPWKLSIFIFCLFLWLSVFIVGHCYDRGKQYGIIDDDAANYNNGGGDDDANNNNNNNNAVDDAYLEEFDDDAVLMETRWCGSKLLHFMWMISVAITVLAMSYCSIIGYVKVRDIAVAAGRSQPAGTFDGGDEDGLKSDYYSKVDNVSGSSGAGGGIDEESGSNPNNSSSLYSSYQAGLDGKRRYEPSIYQSNGMPQFLGGHIYRPTQAAVSMTNRP
eukprot:CAMPEP_0201691782 /NCGR_PEP_ID=MMETSP0578-20130828/4848_1 /ASSEMBLY_ACC=CAM_ASM_000663 /TAXON_ID=267565 /ORGANISM="Skeletonema grethea, Strain CCMP 1804" /LENGTH=518 /DNA_ID=CAMNT_0048177045 /DNA_START=113 /DNA_END=1669 /DNA_ORIENTATION=-